MPRGLKVMKNWPNYGADCTVDCDCGRLRLGVADRTRYMCCGWCMSGWKGGEWVRGRTITALISHSDTRGRQVTRIQFIDEEGTESWWTWSINGNRTHSQSPLTTEQPEEQPSNLKLQFNGSRNLPCDTEHYSSDNKLVARRPNVVRWIVQSDIK